MSFADDPRAVVVGVAGPGLRAEEAALFARTAPLGFILFARNVVDPEQLRRLTTDLKQAVGRDAPIFIDQEGGRVARLRPPHWQAYVPAQQIGAVARRALAPALRAAYLQARLIAHDLHGVGIDVNCAPCLDLRLPETHEVIGDRAYGADPTTVAALGRAVCEGLFDGGLLPVIKHLPGHGRARVDSHHELPVVEDDLEALRSSDFMPFSALRDMPLGMTAHIVYSSIDPRIPLSQSQAGIEMVVRGLIGFSGVLISDDLDMQALSGSLAERTEKAFAAGCDLALQCNGDLSSLEAVLSVAPVLDGLAAERMAAAQSRRIQPNPGFEPVTAWEELNALLSKGVAA